ncbi:hypothetical protein BU17DRAFT_74985 [Hysterangium stoloniferum]|nr:hypothetical protein BU17DRAFT_74985 [Hysterangium stoloniferum]
MYLQSLYPPLPHLPPTNFHNLLFCTPEQRAFPDYVMYIDAITGRERKRSEFVERLYDAATGLGAERSKGGLGLGNKDMVGILSDNCMVWPLLSLISEYTIILHALLVISTPFAPFSSYATHPREMNFPEENIFILEGEVQSPHQFKSLDSLIEVVRSNRIPREPVRPVAHDTIAYIVFSSGTSGLPKAVMISHSNLCASLLQDVIIGREVLKVANPPPDPNFVIVSLGFLPLFHSMALHHSCLKIPLRPSTMVLMPRWDLDLALKSIQKYRINFLALIPSVVHQLVYSPKLAEADLSSVVTIGCGAAYLPPLLAKRLLGMAKNASYVSGYGMSEATISILGTSRPGILDGRVEYIADSNGILVPGLEAVILRPDGSHCLPDEAGELYVKGRNIALGYWNDPEATKNTFILNGWLRTGDRLRANTQGIFWFEDRVKETIKVSGLQVSPAELEETILDEPTGIVNDVAVAGVQTPGARTSDDQSPRAWIVLNDKGRQLGEARARKEIEAWVKESLSKYKWLRGGIHFVDQIPKNPTGKVLKRVLQEQYAAETARAKL